MKETFRFAKELSIRRIKNTISSLRIYNFWFSNYHRRYIYLYMYICVKCTTAWSPVVFRCCFVSFHFLRCIIMVVIVIITRRKSIINTQKPLQIFPKILHSITLHASNILWNFAVRCFKLIVKFYPYCWEFCMKNNLYQTAWKMEMINDF